MNVFINGCSYTEDLINVQNWSRALVNNTNWNITNYAKGGSGNRFICETTLDFLDNNEKLLPDLVIIMWSGLTRKDVEITKEEYEDMCTRQGDNRYVGFSEREGRYWLGAGGVWGRGSVPLTEEFPNNPVAPKLLNKYFEGYWLFDNPLERAKESIDYMNKLQGYLKTRQIPYVFTTYQNYWNKDSKQMLKEKLNIDVTEQFSYNSGGNPYIRDFKKLNKYAWHMLDFKKFCWAGPNKGRTIFELAMEDFPGRTGTYDNGDHPGYEAGEKFVNEYLLPKVKQLYQIDR